MAERSPTSTIPMHVHLLYGDGQKMSESEDHPVRRDEDSQPVGLEQKIVYLISKVELLQKYENTVDKVQRDNEQLTEKCATLELNQMVLLKALVETRTDNSQPKTEQWRTCSVRNITLSYGIEVRLM